MDPLLIRWMGRIPYGDALALQDSLVARRRAGSAPDTLLLLEHPPVITLGRGADPAHVLLGPAERSRRGIELFETGRGGDVTYHGPGQLVGYPIVGLREDRRDARRYLRDLEKALCSAVAEFGIEAATTDGLTGVWCAGRKLAALGVRISTGWITSHGFALNVNTDLSAFGAIVPCGIRNRGVTSMATLRGGPVSIREVAAAVARHVASRLGLEGVSAPDPRERLEEAA